MLKNVFDRYLIFWLFWKTDSLFIFNRLASSWFFSCWYLFFSALQRRTHMQIISMLLLISYILEKYFNILSIDFSFLFRMWFLNILFRSDWGLSFITFNLFVIYKFSYHFNLFNFIIQAVIKSIFQHLFLPIFLLLRFI